MLTSLDMAAPHFLINGGRSLNGQVTVPGAKNAALKMIAAAILTDEQCVLENVPQITDVARMLKILRAMGADIDEDPVAHRVAITARSLDPAKLPEEDIRSMRASIVLLGPLLVRCGSVTMPYPGGDVIGARSITPHLRALEQLGAEIYADGSVIEARAPTGLHPGRVILPEFSVTATENVVLAASGIPGRSMIEIAALEPHVQDLGTMLTAMGAHVAVAGPHTYVVDGAQHLSGTTHRIVGDMLDAFTFLVAALVTKGQISIAGVDPRQLTLPLQKLREMGASVTVYDNMLAVSPDSGSLVATTVQAMPYPGVPSDLQSLFALLATQAEGTTLIQDPLYENRFRYLEELVRMGANASLLDSHRAIVRGPTPLFGTPISSFDIRAGAVLVLAGLMAHGSTRIEGILHIDRGYESLDARLRNLGADIQRIN